MANAIAEPVDDYRKRQSFDFGGTGGLPTPKGFEELDLDDEVCVCATGKVTRVSKDKDGAALTILMSKVDLMVTPEKDEGETSMGGMMEKQKKARKM
jgi:hypothetical protein